MNNSNRIVKMVIVATPDGSRGKVKMIEKFVGTRTVNAHLKKEENVIGLKDLFSASEDQSIQEVKAGWF